MLSILGSPRRCCDGVTRRETLAVGALTALGALGSPHVLSANTTKPGAKAKSVILLYLLGGAATQDMVDLKLNAPSDVRSQFQPIPTSATGVQVCEHLPQMAKWMHRVAVVRSVTHAAGCHNTLPSYTGHEVLLSDNTTTKDSYPPSMGSVCEYLRQQSGRHDGLPDYLYMPCYLGWGQNIRRPGPYGGFLGKRYDALTTECDPVKPEGAADPVPGKPLKVLGAPRLPQGKGESLLALDHLRSRKSLLEQLDDQQRRIEGARSVESFDRVRRQAYEMLTSAEMKSAFALDDEQPELVDRYGRSLFGNSTLLARRLVERGVRFINVTWDLFWGPVKIDYDAWDTHTRNFEILRENKLPGFDQTFSALMEDLDGRGLLDETLVVVMSEMGRTPKINGNGGRDHWTHCYSVLFAGAGIRGGTLYGESDAQAAYVKDQPVSTSDICATIYHLLGISPELRVPDTAGRPVEVAHGGRVIEGLRKVAGELARDHSQQVEVFPVELARMRRPAQHDDPDEPLEMKQRDHRPGARLGQQPVGHDIGFAAAVLAVAHFVERDDEAFALEEVARRVRERLRRNVERAPLPARGEHQFAVLAGDEQQPGVAVGDVAERLDHALLQACPAVAPADRAGEAQPFGPVVVAVLEEMLSDGDLHPSAQPARWQHDQREHRGGEDEADLGERWGGVAEPGERLRRADHHDQIDRDHQQRQRLEGHRPRGTDAQFGGMRPADREERNHQHRNQPADDVQRFRLLVAQVGNGIEVQVADPQRRQRRGAPAQGGPAGREATPVKVVREN
jgi:hypothetical protein